MRNNTFLSAMLGVLLQFNWQAATAPVNVPVAGYKIIYGASANTKTTVVDVGNVLTKNIDMDLTNPVFVAVKAYNAFGESLPSADVVVGLPGTPQNVSVKLAN